MFRNPRVGPLYPFVPALATGIMVHELLERNPVCARSFLREQWVCRPSLFIIFDYLLLRLRESYLNCYYFRTVTRDHIRCLCVWSINPPRLWWFRYQRINVADKKGRESPTDVIMVREVHPTSPSPSPPPRANAGGRSRTVGKDAGVIDGCCGWPLVVGRGWADD